jgi:hypothetical protein
MCQRREKILVSNFLAMPPQRALFQCTTVLEIRQWFWPKLLAEVVCIGLLKDHVTKVRIKTWLWVHVILSSHGTNSIFIRLVSFSLFLIIWKCKNRFTNHHAQFNKIKLCWTLHLFARVYYLYVFNIYVSMPFLILC